MRYILAVTGKNYSAYTKCWYISKRESMRYPQNPFEKKIYILYIYPDLFCFKNINLLFFFLFPSFLVLLSSISDSSQSSVSCIIIEGKPSFPLSFSLIFIIRSAFTTHTHTCTTCVQTFFYSCFSFPSLAWSLVSFQSSSVLTLPHVYREPNSHCQYSSRLCPYKRLGHGHHRWRFNYCYAFALHTGVQGNVLDCRGAVDGIYRPGHDRGYCRYGQRGHQICCYGQHQLQVKVASFSCPASW